MLHEHTDHGLLRCRDHLKPVQRVLAAPPNREHQSAALLANAHSTVLGKPSPTVINMLDLALAAQEKS